MLTPKLYSQFSTQGMVLLGEDPNGRLVPVRLNADGTGLLQAAAAGESSTTQVLNPYTGNYDVLSLAAPPAWFFASALQLGAL